MNAVARTELTLLKKLSYTHYTLREYLGDNWISLDASGLVLFGLPSALSFLSSSVSMISSTHIDRSAMMLSRMKLPSFSWIDVSLPSSSPVIKISGGTGGNSGRSGTKWLGDHVLGGLSRPVVLVQRMWTAFPVSFTGQSGLNTLWQ